eukprot:g6491.t1
MMRRIRETEVCPICQEGDCTQAMLCCGACYHFDCLLSWIRVNSNCPQCRKEIPNTVLYREMQLLEASGPEDLPEGREALQDMQNRARRTRAPVVVHGGAGGGDPFSPFIGGGGGISLLAPIEIGGGSVGNPGYIMGGGPDVGGVVLPTPGGPRHNLMTGRHPHSSLMQHMFEMMASPSGGMFGPGGLGGGGPRHELVIVTSHGDELNPGGLAGGNEGGPRNNGNNSPSGGGGGRDVGRTTMAMHCTTSTQILYFTINNFRRRSSQLFQQFFNTTSASRRASFYQLFFEFKPHSIVQLVHDLDLSLRSAGKVWRSSLDEHDLFQLKLVQFCFFANHLLPVLWYYWFDKNAKFPATISHNLRSGFPKWINHVFSFFAWALLFPVVGKKISLSDLVVEAGKRRSQRASTGSSSSSEENGRRHEQNNHANGLQSSSACNDSAASTTSLLSPVRRSDNLHGVYFAGDETASYGLASLRFWNLVHYFGAASYMTTLHLSSVYFWSQTSFYQKWFKSSAVALTVGMSWMTWVKHVLGLELLDEEFRFTNDVLCQNRKFGDRIVRKKLLGMASVSGHSGFTKQLKQLFVAELLTQLAENSLFVSFVAGLRSGLVAK